MKTTWRILCCIGRLLLLGRAVWRGDRGRCHELIEDVIPMRRKVARAAKAEA